jgi:hypothetical protein
MRRPTSWRGWRSIRSSPDSSCALQCHNPCVVANCNPANGECTSTRRAGCGTPRAYAHRAMTDIVFILASTAFFVVAIAYVNACERL